MVACELGDEGGCSLFGGGLSEAGHPHLAFDAWTRACKAGDPMDCEFAGQTLANGDLGTCDNKRGGEFMNRACKLKGEHTCGWSFQCSINPAYDPTWRSFRAHADATYAEGPHTALGEEYRCEMYADLDYIYTGFGGATREGWEGELLVRLRTKRPLNETEILTLAFRPESEAWQCDPTRSRGVYPDGRTIPDPCGELKQCLRRAPSP